MLTDHKLSNVEASGDNWAKVVPSSSYLRCNIGGRTFASMSKQPTHKFIGQEHHNFGAVVSKVDVNQLPEAIVT